MTRKTRRFIFYAFLFVFLIIVPMIVFYASGYSFDWEKKTLVATGGIYLKSLPSRAEIYIDNKPKGSTAKLIKHLLPKIYEISVIKDGYYPWKKNLTAEPQLVTKAKNILLVPFNPKISLVATGSEVYDQFADREENNPYFIYGSNLYRTRDLKLLVKSIANYVIYKDGIIYLDNATGKIFELDLTTLKSAQMFDQVFPSLNKGKWIMSNDNKKLLCQKDKSVEILWLDEFTANSVLRRKGDIEKIDFGEKINQVIWYPRTDEHLIVAGENSIIITELDSRPPRNSNTFITTENPKILYDFNNKILYFSSQNKIYQTEI